MSCILIINTKIENNNNTSKSEIRSQNTAEWNK